MQAHRRHDISDKIWNLLSFHLPGKKGSIGRLAWNNRLCINAVFWILRTGTPWRDLPPDYGDCKNTQGRICRWRDRGVWKRLLDVLMDDPDYEWLMIDASHIKVHPHAAGAKEGNQAHEPDKRGLNTKVHLAVNAHGMPIRIPITEGTRADCKEACDLIDGTSASACLPIKLMTSIQSSTKQ